MVRALEQAEILEGCRRGDREAFRALFESHKDRVYSIALHYAGDPAAAMDIAQDVFVKLFSRIGGFRGESSFETWLYRLVANCCLDQRRRVSRLTSLADAGLPGPGAPEADAVREEVRRQVRSAVAALPGDLRLAVVLRYTEGLSYDEIARVLSIPAGTVASRLSRAHRDLAGRLRHLDKEYT